MPWIIHTELTKITQQSPYYKAKCSIQDEISRLNKQKCPYCSGFGHAGKHCPTDAKLAQLRKGVREQA